MPSDAAPVLETRDVTKRFGGLTAVDGMSIRVAPGTLTAIIGPNGAGKSTFFNVIAGMLAPTSGRVLLDGRDVTRAPCYRRARSGLARTFQLTRPLMRLTVEQNLRLAARGQLGEQAWAPLVVPHRVRAQERAVTERAGDMLALFDLAPLANEYAGALSGGQKKLLELARALMTEPRVVLLDEPMAGVNPTLARRLLDRVDQLRRENGLTFVLVEHDLQTVFARCDPIIVMARGAKLAEGSAAEIRANAEVVDAYLGG